MPKNEIPRYPLKNRNGDSVSFDLHEWGRDGSYNAQKPHRHSFYEVLIFESGEALHDIDFETYTARANSIHFVGADNVHLVARSENSQGYSLLFVADYMDDALIAKLPFYSGNPTLQLDRTQFTGFTDLILKIRKEMTEGKAFYEQIVRTLLESAFYMLARNAPPVSDPESQSFSRHISAFKELIKEHHTEHKTVAYYAGRLNISAKHLIDICNKQTGKTPLRHIQDHTISEAKRILYHTQLSVKEVAYQLGFNEPSYFSKHFRAVTGYSPITYRRNK